MKTNINASAINADKSLQTLNADLTKLDVAGSQVNIAVAELNNYLVIKSKEDLDDALACLKLCKDIETAIEKRRKELVTPLNDTVKQYNNYVKESLNGKLTPAIEKVKAAVLKYQKEEREKALQARTTARQAALLQLGFTYEGSLCLYKRDSVGSITANELENYEDDQFNTILQGFASNINRINQQQAAQVQEENELNSLFGDATHEVAVAEVAPVIAVPVNGHKVETVKGTTKRWTFEIIDATQVPSEYLMVNETAIRQAITGGVRMIPGIKIFQQEGLTIR